MMNPIDSIEAHKRRVKLMNEEVEIPPDGLSIDLLRAVYRNNQIALAVRMRAASLAIPYECCRLGVSVVVNNQSDLATLLEQRIRRFEQMKLIEAQPTDGSDVIEQPTNGNGSEPPIEQPAPSPAPLRRLYNVKHYRRL